jgi:hypothetical protein
VHRFWRNCPVKPTSAIWCTPPVHRTHREGALRGRFDPFGAPSGNGRYLRFSPVHRADFEGQQRAESAPTGVASATTGVCAKTAIRLRSRNSLHPLRDIPDRKVTHLPRGTISQLIHPPTGRRGPLPSRLHRAEAKVRRDLADLAARFEEVSAETIVEIRALRNEITHMHMIDAAIATERDETLWLN